MFYLDSTPQQQREYISKLTGVLSTLFVDWSSEQRDTALELLEGLRPLVSIVPLLRASDNNYDIYKHLLTAKKLTENYPPDDVEVPEVPQERTIREVRQAEEAEVQAQAHDTRKVEDSKNSSFGREIHFLTKTLLKPPATPAVRAERAEVSRHPSNKMADLLPCLPSPLRQQAEQIQNLYYAPLGRAHQAASKLVEEAVNKAVTYGFIGGEYEGMPKNNVGMKNPLFPDMVRQKLADEICYLDDRLQLLWQLIHFYNDYSQDSLDDEQKEIKDKLLSKAAKYKIPVESEEVKSSYNRSPTLFEIMQMPEGDERKEILAYRVERNKKLLRRQDRKPSEKYKMSLLEAAEELHQLDIPITTTQNKVLLHYGIEISKDWLEPSKEEKDAALKAKHATKEWKEKVAQQKKDSYDRTHPEAVIKREMRAELKRDKEKLFGINED